MPLGGQSSGQRTCFDRMLLAMRKAPLLPMISLSSHRWRWCCRCRVLTAAGWPPVAGFSRHRCTIASAASTLFPGSTYICLFNVWPFSSSSRVSIPAIAFLLNAIVSSLWGTENTRLTVMSGDITWQLIGLDNLRTCFASWAFFLEGFEGIF